MACSPASNADNAILQARHLAIQGRVRAVVRWPNTASDATRTSAESSEDAGERPAAAAIRHCSIRTASTRSCAAITQRYTPEMVERVTGCPQATFLQVVRGADARTPAASAPARSAMRWAGRITRLACRSSAPPSIIQGLLGNIGRPGGGILALRGHCSIQGSTDIPTLYNMLPTYLPQPNAFQPHDTLEEFLHTETPADRLVAQSCRNTWSAC